MDSWYYYNNVFLVLLTINGTLHDSKIDAEYNFGWNKNISIDFSRDFDAGLDTNDPLLIAHRTNTTSLR